MVAVQFWQDSFENETTTDMGGGTRTATGHADTDNGTGPFDRDGNGTIDNADQVELGIGNDPSGNFPFNSSGDDNYFVRYDGNRDTSLGIDRTFSGRDGDWLWIGEDVRDSNEGEGNRPARDNDLGIIDWTGIATTGLGDLSFTGLFASNNNGHTFEVGDFVRVSYAFDSTDAADLVTGIQFVGTGVQSDGLKLDVNQDGVWNMADDGDVDLGGAGTSTTIALQEFSFDLTGSGDTLYLQYQQSGVVGGGASEEVGIDNFRLSFEGSPNEAPVASGIEAAALSSDGTAIVITNSLTLADADDVNIETATVAITSGFDAATDTLAFTDANGITGAYVAATGVLTLTGPATVADFQAALRTVTHANSDAAPIFDREITFTVNDGTDDSNALTRIVDLPTPETDTSVFWQEDFELATGPELGGGTREATGHGDTLNGSGPTDLNGDGVIESGGAAPDGVGSGGASNYFVRTFVTGQGDIGFNAGFDGLSGEYYWRGEDIEDSVNGDGNPAPFETLNWTGIDIADTQNITFDGLFAARVGNLAFEAEDTVTVEYSIDGGAWVTGLAFVGTGNNPSGLAIDANMNGSFDSGETELGQTFTEVSFAVVGTGSLMDLRIVTENIGSNEEIGFDNLRLSGEAAVGEDINGENGSNDVLDGTGASETINGLTGNDVLRGGAGNDELNGGDGNDGFNGGAGADAMNGGDGTDLVVYLTSASGVTVDMTVTDGSANTGEALGDTFSSIEKLFGSNHDDNLTGDDSGMLLSGRDGEDTLNGGTGADVVSGGNDDDDLFGNDGNDLVRGGDGEDFLSGGDGNDRLYGQNDDDLLFGGDGKDQLTGGSGADVFAFDTGGDGARDRIKDFEDGTDLIRYENADFTFEDLKIIQKTTSTVIVSDAGILVVNNTTATDLTAGDFEFVPAPVGGNGLSDKGSVADLLADASPAQDAVADLSNVEVGVFDAFDIG